MNTPEMCEVLRSPWLLMQQEGLAGVQVLQLLAQPSLPETGSRSESGSAQLTFQTWEVSLEAAADAS